jgi:hypothetical protein
VIDETPVVDPTKFHRSLRQGYMERSAIGSANRDYLS